MSLRITVYWHHFTVYVTLKSAIIQIKNPFFVKTHIKKCCSSFIWKTNCYKTNPISSKNFQNVNSEFFNAIFFNKAVVYYCKKKFLRQKNISQIHSYFEN